MYQTKQHRLKKTLIFAGLLITALSIEAKEVLTVEQALDKCKNTYPSQFEAKKRLACFDSISTPALEIKASESLVNSANPADAKNNIAAENAAKEIALAKEKQAPIAVKKPMLI